MDDSAQEHESLAVDSNDALYEECIVSFIDILGFRDLINNSRAQDIFNAISQLKKVTNPAELESKEELELMYDTGILNPTYCQSISDAIVRVSAYDRRNNSGNAFGSNPNALLIELDDIVNAQIELVERGILIRGGISIGKVCIDPRGNNPIFGPGLIRAYDLESNEAVYPRLMIDETLLEEFKNNPKLTHYGADEESTMEVFSLLRTGDDGIVFVDYVRAAHLYSESYDKYIDFLCNHKTLILKNLMEVKKPKIRRKYIWLARYHNRVIEEWRDELDTEENFGEKYEASSDAVLRLRDGDISVRLDLP